MSTVESSYKADNLVKILNNLYGARFHPENTREALLDQVFNDAAFEEADHVGRYEVPYWGELDGKPVKGTADVILAGFGESEEARWVAFAWYPGGWANAVRVATEDTQNMPWLESFVAKEFAG